MPAWLRVVSVCWRYIYCDNLSLPLCIPVLVYYILTCRLVALAISMKLIRSCMPFTLTDRAFSKVQTDVTALTFSASWPPCSGTLWSVLPSSMNSLYTSDASTRISSITESIENCWKRSGVSGPWITWHPFVKMSSICYTRLLRVGADDSACSCSITLASSSCTLSWSWEFLLRSFSSRSVTSLLDVLDACIPKMYFCRNFP